MTSTTNPNTPDNDGWTPIHYAAVQGHLEMIRLLMTSTDANLNAQTNFGDSPTDIARQYGQLEIVEVLNMLINDHANIL